jgi:phenylacetate-CoA ligase
MNKQFLKSIRDFMPEPLKYLTAPVFRNKLINNSEFRNYYDLLSKRESLSSDSIREYQFNQLKSILIYSYQNVPYYQELFDKISFDPQKFSDFEQMNQIPFLTREIVTDSFDKLVSKGNVKNGYYEGNTGGSSGLPLRFLLDYDSIYKENAFIYYYRKKLDYQFKDKLMTFRQVDFGEKLWKFNPMHNEMIFTPMKLSKLTVKEYAKRVNEYGPHYLNGYLSAIWYFAKLLKEYQINITFKLKGIFLISENPDMHQRQFIEEFFNTKSLTFYGHSERCVIAEEIIPDRYLFDPYYGYSEEILIEDNKYAIVGTGFLNHIMPFIRYKTDDVCYAVDKYYAIEGKRSSTSGLYGQNNEFLPNTSFLLRNPVYKNITTYQFIQNEKGKASLLIIVNKHFEMAEMEHIRKALHHQTKGVIELEIKIVDNLILSPRGKYQMFISNIGKE